MEAGILDTLFFALFGLSLTLLIIGLIIPSAFSAVLKRRLTRKNIALFFGSSAVVFFVLLGLTIDKKTSSEEFQQVNGKTPKAILTQTDNYAFDVPSLIGKDIDEVKAVLGNPVDQEPSNMQSEATNEWSLSFKKDSNELLVTYEIKTKRIIDFFIDTDDPSGKTKDKKHLLELGNLREDDTRYRVEFVKALTQPDYFTGVKVIPNP